MTEERDDHNLFTQFARSVKSLARLEEIAVHQVRGASEISLTYRRLFERAAQFAHLLKALGVQPGDRVAAQVEKSLEALILYLACLRSGAVFLPLNTAYTAAELKYFISDAEPKLVVVSPQTRITELIRETTAAPPIFETLAEDGSGSFPEAAEAFPCDFPTVQRDRDDLAAILYTSGTTGRSKGAMLSHENLASNALILKDLWRFTKSDVLIHALPIFHTHGLFVACNVTFFAGASMQFLTKFDADRIIELLPHATVLMGVPTFYVRLLQHPKLSPQQTERMRLFVSGSAPLLAESHRQWFIKTGHAILERYGMTETNMITSNPYEGERRPGTVGFPLPDVSVRITDPDSGHPFAPGVINKIGMIEVKGPNVFSGYWRQPDKTAESFRRDGFFITGDLGRVDADGYVHIVGRGKDLIISGGFNVYPKEVETEIDALEGVLESAVIGLPDPDFGESVTAVVVKKPGAQLDENEIISALADRLAKFKRPKKVIFVDSLPRNSMGKVQKNQLRQNYSSSAGHTDDAETP